MVNVVAKILLFAVKEAFKKQAKRTIAAKLGVNTTMSVFRRFNQNKNAMKKFLNATDKQRKEMLWDFSTALAKKKLLKKAVPIRFIMNVNKYGMAQASKRVALRFVPKEVKKINYFIKNTKNIYEKRALIFQGKKHFWDTINSLNQKEQAHKIDTMVKYRPRNDIEDEYISHLKNKWIKYEANSYQTGNFAVLQHKYNLLSGSLQLPIQSAMGYVKTYLYHKVHWNWIKQAMSGKDFGTGIFNPHLRSENANRWAWLAEWDPNYPKIFRK